jgi:hypothetical protein
MTDQQPIIAQMLVSNNVVNQREGTLLLSNSAMGTDYVISSLGNYDALVITADQDHTMVDITFTNGIKVSYILSLNGTIISSTKPVSVYSGQICKNFSKDENGYSTVNETPCNYLIEALPSTNLFGTAYVFALPNISPSSNTGGNGRNHAPNQLLFVNSMPKTTVTINNNVIVALNQTGQVGSYILNNVTANITTDHPILVTAIANVFGSNDQVSINLVPMVNF